MRGAEEGSASPIFGNEPGSSAPILGSVAHPRNQSQRLWQRQTHEYEKGILSQFSLSLSKSKRGHSHNEFGFTNVRSTREILILLYVRLYLRHEHKMPFWEILFFMHGGIPIREGEMAATIQVLLFFIVFVFESKWTLWKLFINIIQSDQLLSLT